MDEGQMAECRIYKRILEKIYNFLYSLNFFSFSWYWVIYEDVLDIFTSIFI
jgi:hypothetical protein